MQLHDFDMCIAKNEEALRIDPHFSECYGNMANAWKVDYHACADSFCCSFAMVEHFQLMIVVNYYYFFLSLNAGKRQY